MNETRTLCDVEHCGKSGAIQHRFYKSSNTDGAGSTQHWDYTFDLCSLHERMFLHAVLESIKWEPFTLVEAVRLVKGFKIKTRIE